VAPYAAFAWQDYSQQIAQGAQSSVPLQVFLMVQEYVDLQDGGTVEHRTAIGKQLVHQGPGRTEEHTDEQRELRFEVSTVISVAAAADPVNQL
jgi:hypothetical protein